MRILLKDVLGRVVIDSAGRAIGSVEDLALDDDELTILAVRVKLRREVADELGLAHAPFRAALLDVPRTSVQALGDTVVLRLAGSQLRSEAAESPA